MAREYTRKVLELMDNGLITAEWLAEALAGWCSEDDMKEFYEAHVEEEEEELEEEEEELEDVA